MHELIYFLVPTWALSLSFLLNAILYIYRYRKGFHSSIGSIWYILSVPPLLILAQYYGIITVERWFEVDLISHSATSMVRLGLLWQQVILFHGQVVTIRNYRGLH